MLGLTCDGHAVKDGSFEPWIASLFSDVIYLDCLIADFVLRGG